MSLALGAGLRLLGQLLPAACGAAAAVPHRLLSSAAGSQEGLAIVHLDDVRSVIKLEGHDLQHFLQARPRLASAAAAAACCAAPSHTFCQGAHGAMRSAGRRMQQSDHFHACPCRRCAAESHHQRRHTAGPGCTAHVCLRVVSAGQCSSCRRAQAGERHLDRSCPCSDGYLTKPCPPSRTQGRYLHDVRGRGGRRCCWLAGTCSTAAGLIPHPFRCAADVPACPARHRPAHGPGGL